MTLIERARELQSKCEEAQHEYDSTTNNEERGRYVVGPAMAVVREAPGLMRELADEVERLTKALKHVRAVSTCRCDEDYTVRGRHASDCPVEQYLTADDALKGESL